VSGAWEGFSGSACSSRGDRKLKRRLHSRKNEEELRLVSRRGKKEGLGFGRKGKRKRKGSRKGAALRSLIGKKSRVLRTQPQKEKEEKKTGSAYQSRGSRGKNRHFSWISDLLGENQGSRDVRRNCR